MVKILLADDEIETRDNIISCIDWAGNGLELVGAAADGGEALELIKRLLPDIAILDIYMPRLNGLEVIERCRAELAEPPAFIIVSGYSDFAYARQAIRLKVEEYLLKPFQPRELMDAVQRALLQLELRLGTAGSDFFSFVLDCQGQSPSSAPGRYSLRRERQVLNAIAVGTPEDAARSVDEFLADCVLGQDVSTALNYGELLYFEICRLVMERTGRFPTENVFFSSGWTREGVYGQLSEALRRAAHDAQELISRGKNRSAVIVSAVDYIEEHYAEDLTLSKIAGAVFVSPPYLSNLFKEKMGLNLTLYIHQVRIAAAKKLLTDSSMSLQQIAEAVGYRHEKHFMQIFKKLTDMTPSQFRFKKKG